MGKSNALFLLSLSFTIIGIAGFSMSNILQGGQGIPLQAFSLFLIALGVLCLLVLWLWMLVDLMRRPLDNKALWLILLILFSGIAALAYHGLVYRKDIKLEEGELPESSSAAMLILFVLFFAGIIIAVIFTIASGLMFSIAGSTAQVVCKSSDSSRIPINSFDIKAESSIASAELLGEIRISNRSGGKITNIKCTGSGAFAETVSGCPGSLGHGDEAVLGPGASDQGTHQTGDVKLEFTDFSGMQRSISISCRGPITVS